MTSLLHPKVAAAIQELGIAAEVIPCDSNFADTAAFNEKYGFSADEGANTIIVMSKKTEPVQYAVCVVLASTRLDVNKAVKQEMQVKKASFADGETTKQLTDMEIGGVTAVGIDTLPIYVDSEVMNAARVVMGGGNRTSKLIMNPLELLKIPNIKIVEGLAKHPE